ncbi:diguanylate cyclase (GGDEF) domain-containing protein [Paracidovorax valerianellae]|uniref:diguanylate cyclase n=1 Tax=Paracidovorax valerianellae TaxID=187868 RepID=A0A1G6ITR2_9BURK|nr:diguanylate cyclase (GGDEF) domain-containing protein [Paracidovorax valerianellae]
MADVRAQGVGVSRAPSLPPGVSGLASASRRAAGPAHATGRGDQAARPLDLNTFHRMRRVNASVLAFGGVGWAMAWYLANPAYRYDNILFALLATAFFCCITASMFASTPGRVVMAALPATGLLAQGFWLLSAPSPAGVYWCVALGVAFTLLVAYMFITVWHYLASIAVIWLAFGHGNFQQMAVAHDPIWILLLVTMSSLLGLFLNLAISQLREDSYRQQLELETLAYQDALTGLANRRSLLKHLQGLQDAGRIDGLYFLMIDIDDFKSINDQFGHDQGDVVLKDVAAMLKQHAAPHLCGRLGGEEFGVVIDAATLPEARELAQALVAAVNTLYAVPPEHPAFSGRRLSISAGLTRGEAACTTSDLMRRADLALYHAKREGKNRFCMHSGPDGDAADDSPEQRPRRQRSRSTAPL